MSQRPSFLPLSLLWLIPVVSSEFLSHQMICLAKECLFLTEIKTQSLSNSHPLTCRCRARLLEAALMNSFCISPSWAALTFPTNCARIPQPWEGTLQTIARLQHGAARKCHACPSSWKQSWWAVGRAEKSLAFKNCLKKKSESDLKISKVAEQVNKSKERRGFHSVALLDATTA